jgi:predicted NBD/HSP70 family sugar kinase
LKKSNPFERGQENPFEVAPGQTPPFPLISPKYLTVTAIRQSGTLSRTRIAETIGYSPSKITTVVKDLIEDGILEEKGAGPATGARRAIEIGFNPQYGYIVVVRIGFSTLDIALVDFTEHIRVRRMLQLQQPVNPEDVINQVCLAVREHINKLNIPVSHILAFSIVVPGTVDTLSGTLFDTPLMPSWGGYQIDSQIRELFPYAIVFVENEANVMALGEQRKGEAKDLRNLVYINVGKSLNAGIVLNGQVYRGANGRAGDIGQMRVTAQTNVGEKNQPLGQVVSGLAIARQARQLILDGAETILTNIDAESLTARDVGMAATEGDPLAIQIIQQSGLILGDSLANLVTFMDPDLVLIGGTVCNVAPTFIAAIRRSILDRLPSLATQHLRIEIAPLGPDAGTLGAISLALENIFFSG